MKAVAAEWVQKFYVRLPGTSVEIAPKIRKNIGDRAILTGYSLSRDNQRCS